MKIEPGTDSARVFTVRFRGRPDRYAAAWKQPDRVTGADRSVVIVLSTRGCRWFHETGGCVFCSYPLEGAGTRVPPELLIRQFERAYSRHRPDSPHGVKLFTSGSFLDPEEVPDEAVREILGRLAENELVTEVSFESRPEFITDERLELITEVLDGKSFEVGIGLETSDDELRASMNKGFSFREFAKAVKKVREYGGIPKAYVMLKLPFLSEAEAIRDAYMSCVDAHLAGCTRISICPTTIHRETVLEKAWRAGFYRPPWLWTCVEVARRVKGTLGDRVDLLVDTSGAGTPRGPSNCPRCSRRVARVLREFTRTQDIGRLEGLKCSCFAVWRTHIVC